MDRRVFSLRCLSMFYLLSNLLNYAKGVFDLLLKLAINVIFVTNLIIHFYKRNTEMEKWLD